MLSITKSLNLLTSLRGCNNLFRPSFVNMSATASIPSFETLKITVPKEYVYHVELDRPSHLNAINNTMWLEIGRCFDTLNTDDNCRSIVLSGGGKLFCAGIDFKALMDLAPLLAQVEDPSRKAKIIRSSLLKYQKSLSSIEICQKPVLAAVHSACVGGGVDMISAADMRYCTKDAWFQVKEVDIGMAADVGTLQRLPKIIGSESLVRELCLTARKMPAAEALSSGFVSRVFEDKESLLKGVISIAEEIAKKSPVAIQGTKVSLIYARDHTVQEGLDQIGLWNQLMLQSDDFATAITAQITKDKDVVFSKL